MDIQAWLSDYRVIADSDLKSPEAQLLVRFVERHAADVASLVELRSGDRGELVVLYLRTGRPQKSACAIKSMELIAVRFCGGDEMPLVYMLRPDFPDTPHQQLTLEGSPRAICIDDRSWSEARLTWTPAELIHRILNWFARAARGELHDARQPLDPVMIGSQLSFLISRDVLGRADDLDLVGVVDGEYRQMLRVMPVQALKHPAENIEPLCLVAYRIGAEQMRRLTFAPHNLGSLADMLEERGIDLLADLRERFSDWLGQDNPPAWRINSRFAVIVEMPIIAPDGALKHGTDLRAFITDQPVGALAVALGIAVEANPNEGSKVGFVKRLVPSPVDNEAVRAIIAQSAEVHYEFDRTLAAQITGRACPDERRVVMVGAGAIGSHVADCLVREGRFRWTVIDDDRLLPHNIARHTRRGPDVTKGKAALVSSAISEIIHDTETVACAVAADVMREGPFREQIDQAMECADLIIDATASVVAARYLSDHPAAARRASVFFNPAGDSVVLLAEPADRSLSLRDLEVQYLSLVAREEGLARHLAVPGGRFAYTGACRAITNQIPQSRVMALSGLVSAALGHAVDQGSAVIRVFTLAETGEVAVHSVEPEAVEVFPAGQWTIAIDQGLVRRMHAMRNACLPNETGGVLTGVVDIPAKRIHLVDAAPAPTDSQCSVDGFTRGTEGIQEYLDRMLAVTRGQIRYVGEWHSHPPRAGTHPSATDLRQIDWLSTLFDIETLPALMIIAGEEDTRIILANHSGKSGQQVSGMPPSEAGDK